MANETEFGNYQTVAAYIAANMAPYFRSAVVTEPLITTEAPTPGSSAKKFVQKGNVSMSITAESAAATKSEYTETAVTLTLQKGVAFVELSHEAQAYNSGDKLAELITECGMAAGDLWDTEVCKLFDGFANSVGSTGVDLTPSVFMQAAYTADLNNAQGRLSAVLHPTQVHDLQDDIIATQAVVYGNERQQDLTNAQPDATGYKGTLFDIPIYRTTNTESINTGADWSGAIMSKQAICALRRPGFTVNVNKNVEKSLHELAVIMDFQVGEFVDVAGCGIVSDQ